MSRRKKTAPAESTAPADSTYVPPTFVPDKDAMKPLERSDIRGRANPTRKAEFGIGTKHPSFGTESFSEGGSEPGWEAPPGEGRIEPPLGDHGLLDEPVPSSELEGTPRPRSASEYAQDAARAASMGEQGVFPGMPVRNAVSNAVPASAPAPVNFRNVAYEGMGPSPLKPPTRTVDIFNPNNKSITEDKETEIPRSIDDDVLENPRTMSVTQVMGGAPLGRDEEVGDRQSLVTHLMNRVAGVHKVAAMAPEINAQHKITNLELEAINRDLTSKYGALDTSAKANIRDSAQYRGFIQRKTQDIKDKHAKGIRKITKKWDAAFPEHIDTVDTSLAGDQSWTPFSRQDAKNHIAAARQALNDAHEGGHISTEQHELHHTILDKIEQRLFAPNTKNGEEPVTFRDERSGQGVIPGMETKIHTEKEANFGKKKSGSGETVITGDIFGSNISLGNDKQGTVVNVDDLYNDDEDPYVPLGQNLGYLARQRPGAYDRTPIENTTKRGQKRRENRGDPLLTETQEDLTRTLTERDARKTGITGTRNTAMAGVAAQAEAVHGAGAIVHIHPTADGRWQTVLRSPSGEGEHWMRDRASRQWDADQALQNAAEIEHGLDAKERENMEASGMDAMTGPAHKVVSINGTSVAEDTPSGSMLDIAAAHMKAGTPLAIVHHPIHGRILLNADVPDVEVPDTANPGRMTRRQVPTVLAVTPNPGQKPDMSAIRAALSDPLEATLPKSAIQATAEAASVQDRDLTKGSLDENLASFQKYVDTHYKNTDTHIPRVNSKELSTALSNLVQLTNKSAAGKSWLTGGSRSPVAVTGELVRHIQNVEGAIREANQGGPKEGEGARTYGWEPQKPTTTIVQKTNKEGAPVFHGCKNGECSDVQHKEDEATCPNCGGAKMPKLIRKTATNPVLTMGVTSNKVPTTKEALPSVGKVLNNRVFANKSMPQGLAAPGMPVDTPSAAVLDFLIRDIHSQRGNKSEGSGDSGKLAAALTGDTEVNAEDIEVAPIHTVRTEDGVREATPEEIDAYTRGVQSQEAQRLNRNRNVREETEQLVKDMSGNAVASKESEATEAPAEEVEPDIKPGALAGKVTKTPGTDKLKAILSRKKGFKPTEEPQG